MLLPRFTIRSVLYLAVVVALIALVAGQAVQGAMWAMAITIAVGGLVIGWGVFLTFYGIVVAFARVALARELQTPKPAYYPAPRRTELETPNDSAASVRSSSAGN